MEHYDAQFLACTFLPQPSIPSRRCCEECDSSFCFWDTGANVRNKESIPIQQTDLGRHQSFSTRRINEVVECDVSRAAVLLYVVYANWEGVIRTDRITTFFEDNLRHASLLEHSSAGLLCMSKKQFIEVRAYLLCSETFWTEYNILITTHNIHCSVARVVFDEVGIWKKLKLPR